MQGKGDEKSIEFSTNFDLNKNDILRPIEPLNVEEDTFQSASKPFVLRRRKGDCSGIVEKMINYHFKGAKANEMRSRFTIEFLPDSNFNTLLLYYNEFVLSTLK